MYRSTHSKHSLNEVNVKKCQEICTNFQELRFIYSHFRFNREFWKLEKERKKKRKKLSFRSSLLEVFYKNGVYKSFAKFTGKHLFQTEAALQNTHAKVQFQWICFVTLLKSHFRIGVLQWPCCIFSEHLFLRTPLDGCFWPESLF